MSQTFRAFVEQFTDEDNPIGDFARDYDVDTGFTNPYPTWDELRQYLVGHSADPAAVNAAQHLWEAWSGATADLGDEEEWLDDETYYDQLDRPAAGTFISSGYDDGDLDCWIPEDL